MTLVVNLFAAPGSGKSTTAAGLFHLLKSDGVNAELTSEFAKELTWSKRQSTLEDQIYVFAKQHHKLFYLKDQVDVIIVDAPLLLGLVYGESYPECFHNLVNWSFDQYNNLNFLLKRTKAFNPAGRNQTEEESDALKRKIIAMLIKEDRVYFEAEGNKAGLQDIYNLVRKCLK